MPFWPPLERSWALLGRSWGGLGTSWAAPGPSWAAPGGHFGLLGVTFSSFLGGFFGGLARGLQKSSFLLFLFVFLCAVLVLFLILSCLPRGDPGGQANFENHENPLVFSMNLLGWPFCAKCKEHKFQSTGARTTERKTSQETAPATCGKMLQKSLILAPKMPPKSFGNHSLRLPEGQRTRKTRQEPPKRGQERAKSAPRAPKRRPKCAQERPKTFTREAQEAPRRVPSAA